MKNYKNELSIITQWLFISQYKARDPRARSARGRVLYLAYVPYLGMIYVNLCQRRMQLCAGETTCVGSSNSGELVLSTPPVMTPRKRCSVATSSFSSVHSPHPGFNHGDIQDFTDGLQALCTI